MTKDAFGGNLSQTALPAECVYVCIIAVAANAVVVVVLSLLEQ